MKLYKLDLLTLLISLFILSACQNTDSIGLDVDPATDVSGTFIDTVTVKTTTVREDSIVTNSLSQYPLGYFTDPIFGKTSADIALSLSVPTGVEFGDSPVLDSAVLVLHYGDEFYGDSTSRFQIEVHQLAQQLDPKKAYYNTNTIDFNSEVIGSQLVRVRRNDSVRVNEVRTGIKDTMIAKAPHIRIPLNSSFITSKFLNADSASLSTTEQINKHIKGLYLKVNAAQSTGPGGIAFLNLSDSSRLEVYYKNIGASETDTAVASFRISNNDSGSPVAATFNHDYSGTDIAAQLENPNTEYNFTYVQGLSGVRTRLNFPFIKKLKELGNITINKAELIVSVEGGTDNFKPSPRLIIYRTDIAKQRQFIPDFGTNPAISLADGDFGGFYDADKKRYKFVLTSYIQYILNGKLEQYDAYIAPVSESYSRSASTGPAASGTTASEAVLGSGKDGATYKIKLNVFYSKIN